MCFVGALRLAEARIGRPPMEAKVGGPWTRLKGWPLGERDFNVFRVLSFAVRLVNRKEVFSLSESSPD